MTTVHDDPPPDLGWPSAGLGRRRLGTRLRELRLAAGLRLEDVAGRLGVAASTLSRIERGQAPTRLSYLILLADLYSVTDPAQVQQLTAWAEDGKHRGAFHDADYLLAAPVRDRVAFQNRRDPR
jgi:transcriptional regulator with XRE-family HTH domain